MNLSSSVRRLLSRITPAIQASDLPSVRPTSCSLRLLIVDDEEAVRVALFGLLRAIGHDARAVKSGPDALEMLRRETFDMMLCDVRMAEMSGLELMPQAMEIDPNLAILMLTGVNDVQTATDALALGAMDYLVKPIELADLELAIGRAAQRRAAEMDRGAPGRRMSDARVLR
jgi:DNA-binding NtrC family response regulator